MKFLFFYSFFILLNFNTRSLAEGFADCTTLSSHVEYVAKLKEEGLSKLEITRNIRDIAKIKGLTTSQLSDWIDSIDWIYRIENKKKTSEQMRIDKKIECESDRGIVNWVQ